MPTKTAYRFVDDQYVGWCGGEFLSQYGTRDRKEMYHVGPRVAPTLVAHDEAGSVPPLDADLVDNALSTCSLWPAQPESFIELWHSYYRSMQEVAAQLGEVLAHLLGVDRETVAAVRGSAPCTCS